MARIGIAPARTNESKMCLTISRWQLSILSKTSTHLVRSKSFLINAAIKGERYLTKGLSD